LQTLAQMKTMLEERGLSPRKRLGQNFLIDHNMIRKLVDASGVRAGERVMEVGPGTGTLTEELLERGCDVVACELDRGLAELLRERLGGRAGFTLIEGDCLQGKHEINPALLGAMAGEPFTLVANLPYGAATPLMTALLADVPECRGLFVTIQREVADRLMAPAGTRDYGPIGILVSLTAKTELISKLPPQCFWPSPEVHSAMVAVRRLDEPLAADARGIIDFAQGLFEQRRKQIGSVLGRAFPWPEGVAPEARAESLGPHAWIALYRAWRALR
jgi:16S rRNA (adenine1518-N6/adenine1519-N6)-dimethyltransferase